MFNKLLNKWAILKKIYSDLDIYAFPSRILDFANETHSATQNFIGISIFPTCN